MDRGPLVVLEGVLGGPQLNYKELVTKLSLQIESIKLNQMEPVRDHLVSIYALTSYSIVKHLHYLIYRALIHGKKHKVRMWR